jgi:hypothetical protein
LTIAQLAYHNILGLPLIAYLGIISILLLITTGVFGFLTLKGKVSFSWHKGVAITTIVFAFIHAILAMSSYLKF